MILRLLATAFVVLVSVYGAPQEDLITNLPGLPSEPPFRQFSGYLRASETKFLHYWLVESENDPENDPIVVWYNGGPGCSSLGGFFTENGPFRIAENGKDLIYNEFSWNKVANIFFVEAPAGVGLSYAEDGKTDTNDDMTARDNYQALLSFFEKYPEYRERDFYITGESYAGIYIPTLSALIIKEGVLENFKGMAIGNPLLDTTMNDNSLIYFAYFHGMIGDQDWVRIVHDCCNDNVTECDFMASTNWRCRVEILTINAAVNDGSLDPYNLYNKCVGGVKSKMSIRYDVIEKRHKHVNTYFGFPFGQLQSNRKHLEYVNTIPRHKLSNELPCSNSTNLRLFLDNPDVREALHIPQGLPSWEQCSSSLNYTKIYLTVRPQFETILGAKKRVLIYNGDVDMACNFLGDQWFVDSLRRPGATERRQWFYQDEKGEKQVAGWTKHFELIDFLTVKGSGHFVPEDKPRPALKMFEHFLKNKPY